jgi:anti-sigma28 factor (negative regulator of flagellin synthesis)
MAISSSKKIINTQLSSTTSNDEPKVSNSSLKNSKNLKFNESSLQERIKLSINLDSPERQKKINKIKSKIKSGDYYVSSSDVAISILKSLIKESR